jgi:hypothetical protein
MAASAKGSCNLQVQSLTPCGKAVVALASARGSALCKPNHSHTVGRQWQHQHQQGGLHFASTTTYTLWEGNGSISISNRVCTLEAQSFTHCGKAMAASASAMGSALCEHNHLQSVGRQLQHQNQKRGCNLQAQSLTYCGKAMATSESAKGSALCKPNHLQTVRRQWQDQGSARGSTLCKPNHLHPIERQWQNQDQPGILHFISTITYTL